MQAPVLYQLKGNLLDGRYLPGHYAWAAPAQLLSATVIMSAPVTGTLTLKLEVGGVLAGPAITVDGSTQFPAALALAVAVPAGSAVRWLIATPDDPTEVPTDGQLLLQYRLTLSPVASVLKLRWVNGPELFDLYGYAAGTHVFTDISNGLAAGRAQVDQSNGFSLSVQGGEIVRCRNGVFYAAHFGVSVPFTGAPRVEWLLDGNPLAWVTPDGLFLPDLAEGAPAILGTAEFDFYHGSTLAAVLSASGLVAAQIQEGLP